MIFWNSSKLLWERDQILNYCAYCLEISSFQALRKELCRTFFFFFCQNPASQTMLWSTLAHTTHLWSSSMTVQSNPKSLHKAPAKKSTLMDAKASLEFYFVTHFVGRTWMLFPLQKSVVSRTLIWESLSSGWDLQRIPESWWEALWVRQHVLQSRVYKA